MVKLARRSRRYLFGLGLGFPLLGFSLLGFLSLLLLPHPLDGVDLFLLGTLLGLLLRQLVSLDARISLEGALCQAKQQNG